MTAAAQKYEEQFHVMGIDMSKAFDCLDREFILSTAQELLEEDEMRILLYLLSNTTLTAIIGGQEGEKFNTTIGTPQGDSLSPLLFILYLEAVMRKYREELIPLPEDGEFYLETKYADDCDFISHHTPDNNFITETLLPAHLAKYNLKMNPDKTEKTEILPSGSRAINVKKLGSKIGDSADLSYRVQQSIAAFATM